VATPHERSRVTALDLADAGTHAEVVALFDRAESASDHPALAEPSRLAWAAGGDFVGLVLRSHGAVAGYAQLGRRDRSFTVEIVLDPDRTDKAGARRELLEAAASTAGRHGATELRYWANLYNHDDENEIRTLGFTAERDLLQMRASLPLGVDRRPLDEAFSFRAFRPGYDEAAWLAVNNRAFAAHPEQGRWDLATLQAREKTSWFDPDGFILCETQHTLAGSCWTKVHAERQPHRGEIYVISVDPAFQHRGLGRALALAGLDWLAQRVSVGMLYVDKTNQGAVELYGSLGFTIDHVDRCYLLEGPHGPTEASGAGRKGPNGVAR